MRDERGTMSAGRDSERLTADSQRLAVADGCEVSAVSRMKTVRNHVGTMRKSLVLLAVLALLATTAAQPQKKTVFLGSARYDVTVGLSYTRQTSPEGEQGGFNRYTSVGRFEDVKFGPSPSPEFDAWFETKLDVPGANAVVPMHQITGNGEITDFEIAPAWEDPHKAIAPKITAGPQPFEPVLQLLTYAMAHEEDLDSAAAEDGSLPVVPLAPTLWFRYLENFSPSGSELRWEYENFALGAVDQSSFQFSVPLETVADGKEVELSIPFTDGAARGEWTVQFQPLEE